MFPESRQVRLIPYLNGPGHHFFPAVSLTQMFQQGLHHIIPALIGGRRRGIALPVKYGLAAAGQFSRHESQFQEGLESQPAVAVHHPVQICIIVLRTAVLPLLIDGHVIAEQTMSPDMAETDILLHQLKLLLILLVQRQPHPSGADAIIHLIGKSRFRVTIQNYPFLRHTIPFPRLSVYANRRPPVCYCVN